MRVIAGDCLVELPKLAVCGERFHCCVTDPPYHLTSIVKRFGGANAAPAQFGKDGAYARASAGFMGKMWDGGDIAFRPETWRSVYDVLLPGAYLLAFGGTRTYHRMVCAIEDAGFEIRDTVAWLYGSGFPKSHDVSKGIDRMLGAERKVVGVDEDRLRRKPNGMKTPGATTYGYSEAQQETDARITAPATPEAAQWSGWGTALKPAFELICVARKPLDGTVAANVLKHGVGGLNIDASRVPTDDGYAENAVTQGINTAQTSYAPASVRRTFEPAPLGRWPANIITDGSDEVLAAFPQTESVGHHPAKRSGASMWSGDGGGLNGNAGSDKVMDTGSAARFFKECKWNEQEIASINASDAGQIIDLRSELAVSALSDAVEQSTAPWALLPQSYQGRSTTVTASELRTICGSVTALIQNIAQRFSQEWPQRRLTLNNDPAIVVARQEPIGTTTITASLLRSDGCAELATFAITETNSAVGEKGSAPVKRFHYSSKADRADRADSRHPTVKPVDLMRYLVTLVCPPGGHVLDPFAGSGTTGEACMLAGFDCTLIEKDPQHIADIRHRVKRWSGLDAPLFFGARSVMAQPEHNLQVQVVKFVRDCVAADHEFWANDRSKRQSPMQHIREKARGLRAGVADCTLAIDGFPEIYIELKIPPNKPTDAQLQFGRALQRVGRFWFWAVSVCALRRGLEAAGVPLRPNAAIVAAHLDALLSRKKVPKKARVSKPRAQTPNAAAMRAAHRGWKL